MTKPTSIYGINLFCWPPDRYLVRFYRRDRRAPYGEQSHSYTNLTASSLQRLQHLLVNGDAAYLSNGRAFIAEKFGPPFIPPAEEA